jgi:Domain of unknown function (DUF6285)
MSKNNQTASLLNAAYAVTSERIIAQSKGDIRFAGLMLASAIGMAERALLLEKECQASTRDVLAIVPSPNPFENEGEALVHLIRAGVLDADDDAYRRLLVDAILRASITRPAMVHLRERRLAGLD